MFLAATLALLPAAVSYGFVCIQTSNGRCIHWADGAATLRSFLGNSSTALLNGTFNWDQNAINAANDWNLTGAAFHFTVEVGGQFNNPCGPAGPNHVCPNTGPPGDNPVFFANDFCGQGFGDIIELTNNCWNSNTGEMFNAPVFVNAFATGMAAWNAYDGALRTTVVSGRVVPLYDIRRVLLHEFGHVLGLDHPDLRGQTVQAIMNSRISNLDRLQPDDVSGIFSLYPNSAPPPPAGTNPNSCQIDPARRGGLAWMAVPALLLVLGPRRATASGCRSPRR